MNLQPLVISLSLDETLIYPTDSKIAACVEPDFFGCGYMFYKRAHVDLFLEFIRDSGFVVGVFTAASEDYARFVLDKILPEGLELSFLLHRKNVGVKFVRNDNMALGPVVKKHLKKLYNKGYSRDRVVAIDNKADLYSSSYGNVVPVPSFEGAPDDVLLRLIPYLESLSMKESVRGPDHRKLFFS